MKAKDVYIKLNIGRTRLHQLSKEGRIRRLKKGGIFYYNDNDIEKYHQSKILVGSPIPSTQPRETIIKESKPKIEQGDTPKPRDEEVFFGGRTREDALSIAEETLLSKAEEGDVAASRFVQENMSDKNIERNLEETIVFVVPDW